MTEIKIIEIRLLNDGRSLRAFVDVQVGDWIIYEWRVIKKDGQRAWVSVPMASWKDLNHKVRYRALLSVPDEWKQRIELAILSAWEEENTGGKRR